MLGGSSWHRWRNCLSGRGYPDGLRAWSTRVAHIIRPQPPPTGWDRSGGFALLVVLWTLVLVAFIVANITASGRAEIRIAGNLSANAAAGAAADGGIATAIFRLLDGEENRSWAIDGTAHELRIGESRVTVKLADEAARINPNWASPALLEALLRSVSNDLVGARRLAASIGEWVGSTPAAGSRETDLAEGRAAPGAALERLDELSRVPGMTPALFRALRPHLTLFGPPTPSPSTDDPVVAAVLARLTLANQASVAVNQAPPDVRTVRIISVATGLRGAQVSRTAIIRIGPMLPGGYIVLAWGIDPD